MTTEGRDSDVRHGAPIPMVPLLPEQEETTGREVSICPTSREEDALIAALQNSRGRLLQRRRIEQWGIVESRMRA